MIFDKSDILIKLYIFELYIKAKISTIDIEYKFYIIY